MAKRTARSTAPSARVAKAAGPARAPRGRAAAPDAPPAPSLPPPPAMDQIIGQERALAALRAAMESRRIHHAWIFHGPAGVGKFSTAVAFAALLLDPTTAPDLSGRWRPDADSPTQRLIRAWAHPDLHVVTKELAALSRDDKVRGAKQMTIAKEVLEEFLIEPATRTRGLAGDSLASRVFIVDEAELMAHPGQNALLKTLEEPAPGRAIILVTSAEEELLPTIRSRCQRIAFAPLAEPEMRRWLDARSLQLERDQREWLLRYAAGSPGALLSALDGHLYGWWTTLAPMLAELDAGRFPIALGATAAKLADDWAAGWVKRHQNASKEAANRTAARRLFRLLAQHYDQALRAAAGRPDAAAAPLRALDLIAEAERQAENYVQLLFVLENLFAQVAAGAGRA